MTSHPQPMSRETRDAIIEDNNQLQHAEPSCQSRRHETTKLSTIMIALLILVSTLLPTSHAFTTVSLLTRRHPHVAVPHSNGHFQSGHNNLGQSSKHTTHQALPPSIARMFGTIEWSDLRYDDMDTAFNAWEWFNGLSAPATLVAAAVLVTLAESREETAPRKSDGHYARFLKKMMRFLLLTSFALEVVSIFVGAMTGSILLGHGPQEVARKLVGYKAPLALLFHHHEFEFLTTQITFLQGLLNWLGAVTVELILPKPKETTSAKRMNKALAAWLVSFTLWMLAFYNNHINFYSDYLSMIRRFLVLFWQRYIVATPFRPMSLLYGPMFFTSVWMTWRAFVTPREDDDDDGEHTIADRTI